MSAHDGVGAHGGVVGVDFLIFWICDFVFVKGKVGLVYGIFAAFLVCWTVDEVEYGVVFAAIEGRRFIVRRRVRRIQS